MKQFDLRSSVAAALGFALLCIMAGAASAQDVTTYTRPTFEQWFEKYKDAKPDFKPGDVLTWNDHERMRPFVIPGYLEQLNFPEFRMKIIPPQDHTPRKDYMDCTEKYQAQVRLKPDHTLGNYVCGQPFENSSLKPGDPDSAWKAAWNFEYRWQYFGLWTALWQPIWVRFGGTHSGFSNEGAPPADWIAPVKVNLPIPHDTSSIYGGGGTFQRVLNSAYQRTYYTHLAQMSAQGGTLPVPGASQFEYKEFTGFYSPFDIRGTAFIVYRYSDPFRADDAWAYIPTLRRVRRISAEVKSDSLLGTDHTIEDFYGFAGRELEWQWKFLGWKDMLCVQDSAHTYSEFYGPNGVIPNDVWSVRKFAVVERFPTFPRHPYSAVLNTFDSQNWDSWWEVAFDHSGKLWKEWEYMKKWSETYQGEWAAVNHGLDVTTFQSVDVFDLQNHRATLGVSIGIGYPDYDIKATEALFDINNLESVHR